MSERLLKCIPLAALLVGFAAPTGASGQGMGFSVGANFNRLGDIESADRDATLENVAGWHAHLWFDLPIGPVAIRPGIRYMDAGRIFDPESTSGFGDFSDQEIIDEQVVTFLEVPLDLRFRMPLPLITPYALAGPVLRFTTDNNNRDRLEELSMAAGLGVGAELGVLGIRLYPELKYTFGVTRFTKEEYQFRGVVVRPDEDQRLNVVMLSLGIGL